MSIRPFEDVNINFLHSIIAGMEPAGWIALIVTVTAAGLLISERIRPDLVALIVMVFLGLSGIVSPEQTFIGFSGSAVITLLGISVISEGLRQTGVTRQLGKWMVRAGRQSEVRIIMVTMLSSAALSLFMNNIAAVGVLLPAVMSLSRQTRLPASRLLMPLAFGTLLGGMATLLTTSNIIVSGALREAGFKSFGLLEFFPIGGPLIVVGLFYMVFYGRKRLPASPPDAKLPQVLSQELAKLYNLGRRLYEVVVLEGSCLAEKTLHQADLGQTLKVNVVSINHQRVTHLAPGADHLIQTGDILLLLGDIDLDLLAQCGLSPTDHQAQIDDVSVDDVVLAEIVITPHSTLIGRTLREISFRGRYHTNVLAVWRDGGALQSGLADVRLKFGDALLVHGSTDHIRTLGLQSDLIVLQEDPDAVLRPKKRKLAMAITLITLGLAALDILPVAVLVMTGAVMMVLSGCLNMPDIYKSIEWRALFLIAGMWPLSIAIRTTGLAATLVDVASHLLGSITPLGMAVILMLVSLVLVQFLSGQVAALVLAPLALAAAQEIGVDPRGLAMAVALGCSFGFPTPYGHPVNIMVMNPGGYRFRDFLRIGMPLVVIIFPLILLGLRIFWNL